MKSSRKRLLLILLGVAIVCWVVGYVSGPLIEQATTVQQRTDNTIIGGLSFILIFIGIVIAFIDLIILIATRLNHNVAPGTYNPILNVLIAGIVLGIIGMFQPFAFIFYQIGFFLLFFCLIGFMVWSHIVPKGVERPEEIGSVSIGEVEKRTVGQ